MALRTVLKIDIRCEKCKKKVLMALSDLQGIDKLEADIDKGTITVTGDADPVEIVTRARKTGKHVEVDTIGPPPKPEEKKPEEPTKPDESKPPPSCRSCEHISVSVGPSYESPMTCIIL